MAEPDDAANFARAFELELEILLELEPGEISILTLLHFDL